MAISLPIPFRETEPIHISDSEVKVIRDLFSEMKEHQLSQKPSTLYFIVKRFFDFSLALVFSLLFLSWLFPVIALLIKLSSRGPVIFKQERTGKNGKNFTCYKFRTMVVNEHADTHQAVENDARITGLGKILRLTHLDELPQFINILKGEMSFVGPRPHMLYHTEYFSSKVPFYELRHVSPPGITGMAQIKGYMGEIQEERDIHKRVHWDIYYLNHQNLYLDGKIMLKTLLQILTKVFQMN